jgi:hypothetical protein
METSFQVKEATNNQFGQKHRAKNSDPFCFEEIISGLSRGNKSSALAA